MDLLSVSLAAPYAPLRSLPGIRNPHFAPRNLELWNAKSPDTTNAVCIPLSTAALFLVKFKAPLGYNLVNPSVIGYLNTTQSKGDIYFESYGAPDLTSEPGTMIFNVNVKAWSKEVPWGINQPIYWTLSYDLDEAIEGDLPSETGTGTSNATNFPSYTIYSITDDLSAFWLHEGIPVQFLNLFVLPTNPTEHKSQDDWIAWVVKKCFASTYDDDFKNTPGNENFQCIHSYRYDTFGGDHKYVAGSETIFKLDSWLANLKPPVKKNGKIIYNYVNCYDQAALVQTALSLGIPYGFTVDGKQVFNNGRKVKSIGKIFKSAFGFIPPSDLVGWGITNSPFFAEGEKQKLFTQKDVLPFTPHDRELFKDHSWVFLRRSGPELGYTALDACAGPASDPKSTIETYLTTCIDQFATKHLDTKWYFEQSDHKGWWDSYKLQWTEWDALAYQLEDGVISTELQPVINKKGNHQAARAALKDVFPELWKLWEDYRTGGHPNTARFIPVPIKLLVEKVIESVPDFKQPDFYSSWTPFSVGVDGTSFSVDMVAGDIRLTMQVDVLTDSLTAIDWATDYLTSFDNDLGDVFDLPETLADNTSVWDPSRARLRFDPSSEAGQTLLIRNNIVVVFSGSCPVKEMENAITVADNFIVNYLGSSLDEVVTSKVVVSPQKVTAGDNVTFTITGENIVALDVDFEHHYLTDIQDPVQDPENPNIWTLECSVFGPKDSEPKEGTFDDNMHVSFAMKDTYYTTNGIFKIEVQVSA